MFSAFLHCLLSACEIRVSCSQKRSTVARVRACYVASSKHVFSQRNYFVRKEAAGTVSQPVHFGYILLGAFWSFEIFWQMFSRWIMFIPLNTLFHQGERQNAEREACGKNGRAIFDSSTSAHPPIRPLLPFSIFLFHRSYSFSFLFSGARLPDRDQCTMKSRNPARKSPDLSAGPEVRTRLNNIE